MLLRLAWRNLWRNARRTAITMAALSLGVTAIVALSSYREATFQQMVGAVTSGLVGHFQVHGRGYQESPELGTVVRDPAQVEAAISRTLPGALQERRVIGAGLAGAGDSSAPVVVLGIEPERSEQIRRIASGQELSAEVRKGAVIGRGLADALGVQVGQELVLVGSAVDGSVANDRYTVVGTATTDSSEMDNSAVFLTLADAQDLFGLGDSVHQVVVRLPGDEEDLTAPLSLLHGALDLASLEAMSWSEILPELQGMIEQKRQGQRAIDVVVFLIVALGVLNTASMSVFERTRELGVLASLGTRPRRLLGLVMTEALLQGVLSLAIGVGLAAAVLYGIGTIDLAAQFSDQDMMGVRMPAAVLLRLQAGAVVSAAAVSLITVLAGSLVPAVRAARLKPVEAARFV